MVFKRYYIICIIVSLALIPLWGLGLLGANTASRVVAFFAFVLTTIVLLLIARKFDLKNTGKAVLLLGPSIYLLFTLFIIDKSLLPTFPIIWIYLLSLFVLQFKNRVLLTLLFSTILSLIYCFKIFPADHLASSINKKELTTPLKTFDSNYDLKDFIVVNKDRDTLLIDSKKPVIIETWNETCVPCIKAINELSKEKELNNKVTHVYLYQSRNNKSLKHNEIFNFSLINEKENIFIDPNNSIFQQLNLTSYPTFLFFNFDGDLKYSINGFQIENEPTTPQQINKIVHQFYENQSH